MHAYFRVQTLMGDLNLSNQLNNIGDQNQIPTQNRLINHLITRNHVQLQVIIPTLSKTMNPNSESLVLGLAHTFTYDICNAPNTDDLLLEILSRLPLKSIFRFKCVCKHWLNLISHSSFPRLYIPRMLTNNTAPSSLPFRILYRFIYEPEIEGVLDRFRPESYSLSDSVIYLCREPQQSIKFKVLAVCNGLMLCCSFGSLNYYVCDVVTRQRVKIPSIKGPQLLFGEGFVSRVDEDNVLTSFKVVLVSLEMKKPSNRLWLYTFSSETGKWVDSSLRCPNLIALMKRGAGPVNFNGILHWFVYDHGMIAFDPYKRPKSCRLIRFPDDRDVQSEGRHDGLYRLCDACQGKLRLFQVAPDASSFYCFSMWDLKDYEKVEWCSEFKVTRFELSSSDPELSTRLMKATFLPLSFHPLDLDIVYLKCVELACVVSYSIQNRRLDVACKTIGGADDLSWRVVVPFVIPWWPTRVPILSQEGF